MPIASLSTGNSAGDRRSLGCEIGKTGKLRRANGLTVASTRENHAPGGYHIMLMHRIRALAVGDTFPIVLKLADGTTITVPFKIRGASAQ